MRSMASFFRSAYIRNVMAVHEANAMRIKSPGEGPASLPPFSGGSSAINECSTVESLVLYVSRPMEATTARLSAVIRRYGSSQIHAGEFFRGGQVHGASGFLEVHPGRL